MTDHAEWMTVDQAAEFLGVSPDTVARLFDAGRLNGWRTTGGHRRVYKDGAARTVKDEYERRRRSGRS